jgi:hypothetical protein
MSGAIDLDSLPVIVEGPGVEIRGTEAGELSVALVRLRQGHDARLCQRAPVGPAAGRPACRKMVFGDCGPSYRERMFVHACPDSEDLALLMRGCG